MLRIVAFDFDGTIADTVPMCIEAFCESASPYMDHILTEKREYRVCFYDVSKLQEYLSAVI